MATLHNLDAHRTRVVFNQARALLRRSRRLLAEFRALSLSYRGSREASPFFGLRSVSERHLSSGGNPASARRRAS